MALFKRRSSPTAHWSKDFIEHLRTVHFTLIALAVIAIISGRSPDMTKMRIAKSQLNTIRDFVDTKLSMVGSELALYSDDWLVDDKRKLAAQMPFIVPRMRSNPCYYLELPVLQMLRQEWTVHPPESLADFKKIWNELNCSSWDTYVLLEIGDATFDENQALPSGLRETTPFKGYSIGTITTTRDRLRKRQFRIDSLSFHFSFPSVRPPASLKFRPRSDAVPPMAATLWNTFVLDLQRGEGAELIGDGLVFMKGVISNTASEWSGHEELVRLESTWTCEGGYEECFGELVDVAAAGKDKYTFKDLAGWLDDQIATSEPRQIDIFGVRFPADSQTQWGIILIVTVQLYFWMHLRELSPRLRADHSGVDVAWPGLYRSCTAYVVVWVTVVLLPLYALWILGLNRIHYKAPWRAFVTSNWRDIATWLAIPLIVYSVLSVWACLKLRQLALLADAARQKDENEPTKDESASAAQAGAE